MNEENYRKAIKDAEEEIIRLSLYRATVDRKLSQLKAAITVLSSLLEEPPKTDDTTSISDVGISNAIRQILREAGVGLTPAQIKTKLLEADFDLSKYANPSAVIHNTLKRLEGQKEIVPVRDSSGITAYAVDALTRLTENAKTAEAMRRAASEHLSSYADVTGQTMADFGRKIEEFNAANAAPRAVLEKFFKKTGGFK